MKMNIPKRRIITIFILVAVIVGLVVISSYKAFIEKYYTCGIYPHISHVQRLLFGNISFSVGDILYLLAFIWLLYKTAKNLYLLIARKLRMAALFQKFVKILVALGALYIVFLLLWGLNYSREGIVHQLNLKRPVYDSSDLFQLQELLIKRVNDAKETLVGSTSVYPDNKELFKRAAGVYRNATSTFPFLIYRTPSIKSSMYGWLGNYMGFTGYYNPLTGEAQVNTTIPPFLLPAITVHEMAHQLGYAKENAANFVGFLVGTHSDDPLFRYSAWFDLFLYANSQVWFIDSLAGKSAFNRLNDGVKSDIDSLRRFNDSYQSFAQPVFNWIYGKYLTFNNQPLGIHSYSAVVALVIAYYKKNGLL